MKKLISLAAAALVAGALVLPAPAASAALDGHTGSAVAACQVTLSFPGRGSTICGSGALSIEGHAYGAFVPTPVCGPCNFSADVADYEETCVLSPLLMGTANGTLHIGSIDHDFEWLRVGSQAVIESADGSLLGTAAFVPVPPLGTCANPNPAMTAHVVGAVIHT